MSKVKCGILFNGRQNLFKRYLEWIVKEQSQKDFDVSFVHTNNPELIKDVSVNLGSYEEVISNSDVVFSLGYWKKIRKEDIKRVDLGIVNCHHSYELKFRGRHCATWAIRHNEKLHGSTMHFIDENIDEGKIIDSACFTLHENDVAESVFNMSNEIGFSLLKRNFHKIITGQEVKYQPTVKEKHTYRARDLSHEIQLELDSKSLLRKIRSLTFDKMPAPYLLLEGRKVYLKLDGYDNGKCEKQ